MFFSNITVQELEVTSNILVSFQYKYVLIFLNLICLLYKVTQFSSSQVGQNGGYANVA